MTVCRVLVYIKNDVNFTPNDIVMGPKLVPFESGKIRINLQ
jgi:hypothetical protein